MRRGRGHCHQLIVIGVVVMGNVSAARGRDGAG
jgi:hypothetical protein